MNKAPLNELVNYADKKYDWVTCIVKNEKITF